jgi:phytoene dehydrogenase-like protein
MAVSREKGAKKYDAIVIGAGYGGLITGAILGKNGLKTILVEPEDQIGGKGGAVYWNGYWLDWGLRDGRDTTDFMMVMCEPNLYGKQAAQAAGADVKMVEVGVQRTHIYPDDIIMDMDLTTESMGLFFREILGVPSNKVEQFQTLLNQILGLDPQKYQGALLKQWLDENVSDEALRKAFIRFGINIFSIPPEDTSIGRLSAFYRDVPRCFRANDPEVGGQQGWMEPYARVIRKHGAEIMLGQEPLEILVDGGGVKGVVIRDKAATIQELYAPRVVYTWLVWDVFKLINEKYFPRELVDDARKLEQYNIDTMVVNMGLSRLPTIRQTGKTDDYTGFHRVVVGPKREYAGGWLIGSISSVKQAPPGKHLLNAVWCTGGVLAKGYEPFKSYAEAKDKIVNNTLACIRHYYSDIDEITEWVSFHLHKPPSDVGWSFSPVPRVPVKCPSIEGLYFVGTSTEVTGAYQDMDAHSALIATDMILKKAKRP